MTIIVALIVATAAPFYVLFIYLPGFVTSDRPLDAYCGRADIEPLPIGGRSNGRLSVVIIDGLGFDYAKQIAELAWLREAGVTRPLAVPYPSYTTPALLSFVTGLDPRDSGVRLNADLAEVTTGLDNLTVVARDAGRPIAYFGGGWDPFAAIMFAETVHRERVATAVSPFLARGRVTISYFGAVDEEGHVSGEASQAYRHEVLRANTYLRRHWSILDPERDHLLVVSDHGHLQSGGHGGVEPNIRRALFAVAGKDIRRGVELDQRPLRDVAATIAVLSGLKTPACNTGRPMLDMLLWSDADKARALASPFQQAGRMLSKLASDPPVEPTVEALAKGDGTALRRASKLLDDWRAEYDHTTDGAVDNLRLFRVSATIGVLLLLLIYCRKRLMLLVPPAVVLTLYSAFLLLRGYRPTFSKMPQQEDFLVDAAIAAVIAIALVSTAVIAAKKTRDADLGLFAGALPWLGCAVYSGFGPHTVAPPLAGLLVFLWGPSAIAAALTAAVVRIAEHRRLSRSVTQADDL